MLPVEGCTVSTVHTKSAALYCTLRRVLPSSATFEGTSCYIPSHVYSLSCSSLVPDRRPACSEVEVRRLVAEPFAINLKRVKAMIQRVDLKKTHSHLYDTVLQLDLDRISLINHLPSLVPSLVARSPSTSSWLRHAPLTPTAFRPANPSQDTSPSPPNDVITDLGPPLGCSAVARGPSGGQRLSLEAFLNHLVRPRATASCASRQRGPILRPRGRRAQLGHRLAAFQLLIRAPQDGASPPPDTRSPRGPADARGFATLRYNDLGYPAPAYACAGYRRPWRCHLWCVLCR